MTTPPLPGTKNDVPSCRSKNTISRPAVRTGAASTTSNDVARMLHVNTGIRIMVIPGVRIRRIVTMKLIPPRIDARADDHQPDEPQVLARPELFGQRRVVRPPRRGAAALREEAGQDRQAADGQQPERQRVDPRERHVERADLQRNEVVPEAGEQREDHEEDHQRAVQGEELVVGVRSEDLRARPRELAPHQQREHAGDDEEREAVDQVRGSRSSCGPSWSATTSTLARARVRAGRSGLRLAPSLILRAHDLGATMNAPDIAGPWTSHWK